ncbi:MAG: hypothetical protein A4E49_01230 [Methanosaeta sp. PtaU1.Bin112]|nr:MAG: hypothetical protein A4E49_01230 [Methanosaeta sp. PtaU1.Bin112]
MQKKLVSLICALALLAFIMPATAAEESLNATANTTLNATTNITINETSNLTAIQLPKATTDAIGSNRAGKSQESAPYTAQLGKGKAASDGKVLRAGFEKTKPVNNLDVYGNKSTYSIPFSTSKNAAFEVNQRRGNVSQFTYNTKYKPLYNISQYSRSKPTYEVPSSVSSKPVYSITSYPEIKAVNSIP